MLLLSACVPEVKHSEQKVFELEIINDSLAFLSVRFSKEKPWELSYPIYQFEEGDVDMDGNIDALLGVVKSAHFDPIPGRRLFIFKNYKGFVRPLWLGSKMPQPLIDFCFVEQEKVNLIRTIELEASGNYLVAEYIWKKFGLELSNYLKREINLEEAKEMLCVNI